MQFHNAKGELAKVCVDKGVKSADSKMAEFFYLSPVPAPPFPFCFPLPPSPLLIINLEKLSPPVPFFLFLPSDRPGRKWGALITRGQIDFSLLLLLESDCRLPANYSGFSGAEGEGRGGDDTHSKVCGGHIIWDCHSPGQKEEEEEEESPPTYPTYRRKKRKNIED